MKTNFNQIVIAKPKIKKFMFEFLISNKIIVTSINNYKQINYNLNYYSNL